MSDARRHYVERIRRDGVPMSSALAAAFAAVPREVFVADGFRRRDGTRARPGDADFLSTVYSNDVLVTKVAGDLPVSSSSQPSLMAVMLSALDLRPGLRVLEIGAGTGYNAALMSHLGARVTSIDVQPDVAGRAAAALRRAGVAGVRVEVADGYYGGPPGRYDRVIVTVGVSGISPHWLDRLEPADLVLAPVEHAGTHPVLAVSRAADGPVTASVVCPAGFMSAAGPLAARHRGSHPPPAPAGALAGLTEVAPARWRPPLDSTTYRDLWHAAGAWHQGMSHAAVPGREQSCLALLDPARAGGAVVLPDGAVLATGPHAERYAAEAGEILDRWWAAGRPPATAWRVRLTSGGAARTPIWVPTDWSLAG